jgi:hypothetical protein
MIKLKCMCGHYVNQHIRGVTDSWCCMCETGYGTNLYHEVKVDNLTYIEDLAKQKGLIDAK